MRDLKRKYRENKKNKHNHCFEDVLVIGGGNAAGTLIPRLYKYGQRNISLLTANNSLGRKLLDELDDSQGLIESHAESDEVSSIRAVGKLKQFYLGYTKLDHEPQLIFLCTPNQYYRDVIYELGRAGVLEGDQKIVGISTRVGSGFEILKSLQDIGRDSNNYTVVSFSTYYAATKGLESDKNHYISKVNSRAVKRKVHAGFCRKDDKLENYLRNLLGQIGTEVELHDNTLSAEAENANTYIHAQVTLVDEILEKILTPEFKGYLYRFIEEDETGTLSMTTMERIVAATDEINLIWESLATPKINLLSMLVNDLYPVPKTEITNKDVETFQSSSAKKRAELINKWFQLRQSDPFSKKDAPHLRSVRLPTVSVGEKYLEIPRVPGEDYQVITLLTYLAQEMGTKHEVLISMKNTFERKLKELQRKHRLETSINPKMVNKYMESLANHIKTAH